MLAELIQLVATIWHSDSEIRDSSLVGESRMDRQSRRLMAWLCGGAIFLLTIAGTAWWWLAG